MRRFSIFLAFVLILALSGVAQAQTEQRTFAVFNLRQIVAECDMTKAERARMEATFGAERTKLQQMETTIQQKAEQMRTQAGALSIDAQQDRQTELVRLQRDYEDAARALARKLEAEEGRIREAIIKLLVEASKSYATKHNIDMILDGTMSVIYASDAIDITQPLMNEVNALYKAGGGN